MASWLRLVFAVIALVGLMAQGTGGALAAKAQHSDCAPPMQSEMVMAHHHGSTDTPQTAPVCCLDSLCTMAQPNLPSPTVLLMPRTIAQVALVAIDDKAAPSRLISPNLRPPIA